MACIIVRYPDGRELKFQDGQARMYVQGEQIVGVDYFCEGKATEDVFQKLEKEGVPIGSAIAWVTKRLGIKQCASCKAREEILNHAQQLGWLETVRQIKETF